jgi:hypothetical protein
MSEMRVRIDCGENWNLREIGARAYTDDFLTELGKSFGFNALQNGLTAKIKLIGLRYIRIRGAQLKTEKKHDRQEYERRQRIIDNFTEALKCWESDDIATDSYFAALKLREPRPETDFPDLTEHQKIRGEPYLRELHRILKVLKAGNQIWLEEFKSRPGKSKNAGLESLVRNAAEFWVTDLRGKFTVDYHEGAGLGRAFEFVQTLMKPIDDVTDEQIITAMRTEIRTRRALDARAKSKRRIPRRKRRPRE